MNRIAQGMTLLEVMVALFIFAVAGMAIMKTATDHLNNVGVIEEITWATYVANNQLTRAHLDDQWPPKANIKGSEQMAGRTWYWQQTASKTNDDDLRAIVVSVGLSENYEDSITSVTSFVAKPNE
ncbi:type II secretion system minor pseudopilin GspI [Alteromonas facilis]|uniref:type II secretion system minor pseudopilin GspI n=1 Tax=Alteromonas facilis TaxID=2048004 RepID=UPI000C28E896|nr:type II secretion system minor pseudopilin GspI [Alteromonas facilis]